MKASGKLIGRLIVGCVFACCLSRFTLQSFAIEGLKISVHFTNAVLSWPSTNTETYIIQYRNTLSATDSWATLADYYPADSNTNITHYVDSSDVVQFSSLDSGGGSGGGIVLPPSDSSSLMSSESSLVSSDVITDDTSDDLPPLPWDIIASLSDDGSLSANGMGMSQLDSGGGIIMSPDGTGGGSSPTTGTSGTGFYRVVRDGAHLFGLTNGAVLSGIVKLPVELANGSGSVSTMSLTEDDSPVGNSIQTTPLVSPSALIVDTTQMSNGVHQVSASARWDDTNGGLWEADSPPISVTISNEISFENWIPSFGETGNTFLFRATSAHTNTDWVVYVYGNNTYLGYFSGHTYDGDISFYYDFSGTSLTNISVFSFEIATEYVDPPAPPTFKVTDPWSGPGAWVVVAQHAWDNALDPYHLLYGELGGFIGGALNVNWPVMPPPQGQNDIGSWLAYGLTFGSDNPQGDTDWQAFRNALYDSHSRNLVFFGHGGPNGIGYNPANTNRFISSTEIANRLNTIPAGQLNRHAFRFVFLDGCATAQGNLPEAFGILHRKVSNLDDYTAASLRPSAFVGWTSTKWIDILDGAYINYDHVNFISHIQTQMLLGWGLQESIDYAASAPDVHWAFLWLGQMKVYGYYDLHFGQFNN